MSLLKYNLLKPRKSVPSPSLLLMLHGYGSDENDLFSFAEHLNNRFLVVSAKAPRPLPWGGNAWYDINFTGDQDRFGDPEQALDSMSKVSALLSHLKVTYNTSKTVLLGFSQGAILSYALSANYPGNFDHVLALSGYIFKDIMPNSLGDESSVYPEYFVTHGKQDEVIPLEWSEAAHKWLEKNGLTSEYHQYEMGHGINPECFQDMIDWISKRYPIL